MKLRTHIIEVFRVVAIVALIGLCTASIAQAATTTQPAAGLRLTARFGFDSYYKDSQWIPVRITVENDGPDVRGQLRIVSQRGFSGGEVLFTREVELPTQSRRELFLYVAPEGSIGSLTVALVDGAKTLASTSSRVVSLSGSDLLYGVLAESPSAFNGLSDVRPYGGNAFVAALEAADLPSVGAGWQALDVLVVSDVDTGALSLEQRAALTDWIQNGGRLIVAGGPAWQKTAAGLSALLPVQPAQTQTLTDFSTLANFASSDTPEGNALAATGPLTQDAVTLASTGGTPLVVTRRLGFGQVFFLAVDPAFTPLRGWEGVIGLFRGVLTLGVDRPNWSYGVVNTSSAQDAVNSLPNLALPSPLLICGFLGVYLAIIGPINYFVLHRIKRRELAWITIPVIVLVFSLTAYLVGYQFAGSQPILHQLALVQVWPDSDQAHVDQIVGVFSPRRTTYDVQFADGYLARPMPSYSTGSGSLRVEQGDATRVYGVRTEIASVETFLAQGLAPAPRFESTLRLDITGGSARLSGSVTNQSDVSLDEAVLIAPGGTLRLGLFKPGETREVALILSSSRAVALPQNAVMPFLVGGPIGAPPPYYPSTYDSTVDDILGGASYNNDRESFRRYATLNAFINTYGGLGRGSGVYVVGWTETAPANAKVLNVEYSTHNATVYLIALQTALEFGTGAISVPPGLMTWTPLEIGDKNGAASPYDATVYQDEVYSIRFTPVRALRFTRVAGLTLHLGGSSYGPTAASNLTPVVELWDIQQNTWVPMDTPTYGDTPVADPGRYVGPGGAIHVRIRNPGVDTITLNYLDFTLTVER